MSIAGVALTAAVCIGYMHLLPQLNGPVQWKWTYFDPDFGLGAWLRALGRSVVWLIPGAAAIGGAWALARRRWRGRRRTLRRVGLALLLAWGVYYQWIGLTTFLGAGAEFLGETALDAGRMGYLSVAQRMHQGELPPPAKLLDEWAMRMAEMPPHVSTHPPGLVLAHYGSLWLFDGAPMLTAAAAWGFEVCGADLDALGSPRIVDRVAAMTAGALLLIGAVGAGLPLFTLVRASAARPSVGERRGWIAAALWVHYPALACFTPSYDQFFPLLVLGTMWAGWRGTWSRRPAVWGAVAGAIAAAGLWLAFNLMLWLPLAAVTAALGLCRWRARARGTWWEIAGAGAVMAALLVALPLAFGADPAAIFRAALENQRRIAASAGRTWEVWVWAGPLDFLKLAGPAVALPALVWCAQRAWRWAARPAEIEPMWAVFPLGVAMTALAGLMPGENARLWLMFAPGVVWAAAGWLAEPGSGSQRRLALCVLLAAQHIYTLTCLKTMRFM